ncbi:MAG: amidohydrolase family protein [Thermaerobacter sp.]
MTRQARTLRAMAFAAVVGFAVGAGAALWSAPWEAADAGHAAAAGAAAPEAHDVSQADQAPAAGPAAEPSYTVLHDIVIAGGRVMDPASGYDRIANVGILGGTIWTISETPLRGKVVLDASGHVVAPGFIDIMSYEPNSVGSWLKLADGVTTNLALHGGASDPDAWYARIERSRPPLHYGASFFYGEARLRMGIGNYRAATPQQIAQLVEQARRALDAGALGVSLSLEYMPGISEDEVRAMMQVAAEYGAPAFFHLRYSDMEEPGTNFDALREVIDLARETGARFHIDHINSTGGTFSMAESLRMIEEARAEGIEITADVYPYDYWGTYLNSARFDPGWQQRFRIGYGDLQIAGTSERLTPETFAVHRRLGTLVVAYAIPEEDVRLALQAPFVMIGSDGIIEPGYNNHPRGAGNFSRTLGRYVREEGVLDLMEALAKMTIMPARLLEPYVPAMAAKGRLQPGADADIVVFDPATVSDRATVEQPYLPSVGYRYVLVDGQIVLKDGELDRSVRAGKPIRAVYYHRHPAWQQARDPHLRLR